VNIYFTWKPDTLHLADVLGDEDEGQYIVVNNNKRAGKSADKGRTASASLESPQKRKQAVGVRTRRQAQLEDGEGGMLKQGDAEKMVKKEEEDDDADDLNLDLPSIDDLIDSRA
jgi:hypothetical protein